MIAVALSALLLAAEPQVQASFPPGAPPKDGLSLLRESLAKGTEVPKIGEWVTMELGIEGAKSNYWRFAAVSADKDRKGRAATWYEMELGQHPAFRAPLFQMKMLVTNELGFTNEGISRVFVQLGTQQPRELTEAAVGELLRREPAAPPADNPVEKAVALNPGDLRTKYGDSQRLMTAAGTVTAVPVEMIFRQTRIERFWVSPEIPILHLARMEITGLAYKVEVRDFGVDAKPRMLMPSKDQQKIDVVDAETYMRQLPSLEDDQDAP